MQQGIFTCHYVHFGEQRYPVHWLRLVIDAVTFGPKQNRLFRINEKFSVSSKPLPQVRL
jgi:arginine-tRNA-protein transferase